jgi:hypothetical protein
VKRVFIAVLVQIQLYYLLGTQLLTFNFQMEQCHWEFIFMAFFLPCISKLKDEGVSSKQDKDNKSFINEEFYQWFSGFSDAESCFLIQPVLNSNKTKISRFSYKFIIELHKDDLGVLEFIKKKLEIGNIRLSKETCIFMVSDKKGIYTLINIFDKYNLNTTKYLDYFDFKKAFILYFERRDLNLTGSRGGRIQK